MSSHHTTATRPAHRIGLAIAAAALALGLAVAPTTANHTFGVLDCGDGAVYEVEAASIEAMDVKFDTPAPWSGLLLLEDTTRVFKAFSVVTPKWSVHMPATEHYPRALESCTLTSEGPNFATPWILTGRFIP